MCAGLRRVDPAQPSVSMLWESTDPNDVLKERFGFESVVDVTTWLAETLPVVWGIAVGHLDRVVISGWNAMAWIAADDRHLIVKWSALPTVFPRLVDASAVTVWLDQHEIPVASPIASLDGRRLVEVGNDAGGHLRSGLREPDSRFLVGVLPVRDGTLLDVSDHRQVVDAGEMLAALHETLDAYPGAVGGRLPSAGEQLVHNDFRSANILHDGSRISAVLDLEEITFGKRVADLAKAAVMLGAQYRDWAPTPVEVRIAFIDSYSTRCPLTAEERHELTSEMTKVLAAKWWH